HSPSFTKHAPGYSLQFLALSGCGISTAIPNAKITCKRTYLLLGKAGKDTIKSYIYTTTFK
ncbi:hypothetical protein J9332_21070, partial [Aquimarina celericrescens]|nr:hypothetical protein [Aquimarina celericrescens]